MVERHSTISISRRQCSSLRLLRREMVERHSTITLPPLPFSSMRSRYSFFHRLLDLIAPSACFCCGRRLAQQERFICVACQRHLPYTNHHLTPDDNEMVRLLWLRIPVNNAAALYRHMPHAQSARIIYDIKYHHQPELARYMGQLMAQTFLQNSFFNSSSDSVHADTTKACSSPKA